MELISPLDPTDVTSNYFSAISKSSVFPSSGSLSLKNPYTYFVASALPAAEVIEDLYGIPAAVSLTQAIIESKSAHSSIPGSSLITRKAKNWFGIKADSSWKGAKVLLPTTEYANTKINAYFRSYPSNNASWNDYGEFLSSNPRYAKAFKTKDPSLFLSTVLSSGYATGPGYKRLAGQILASVQKRIALVRKAESSSFTF